MRNRYKSRYDLGQTRDTACDGGDLTPGKQTRCAIGTSELPLNFPIELDLIAELKSP